MMNLEAVPNSEPYLSGISGTPCREMIKFLKSTILVWWVIQLGNWEMRIVRLEQL